MNQSLLHEAEYYDVIDEEEQIVQCHLCPFECQLKPDEKGKCLGRMNITGKLYSLTYGCATMKIDLIEKQHVFHFFPSARVQTFATYNCNLDCIFCSCSDHAHIDPEQISGKKYTPDQVAMFGIASGSKVVCFGDSEPLIAFEWVRDAAKASKERGLKVLLRTNGFFNEEPMKEILNYVDAVMIEVKAIDTEGYNRLCKGGDFDQVAKTMKLILENEIHLEISIILHKQLDNDEATVGVLANFIKTELTPEIPIHLIRMLPAYKTMDLAPTKTELLEKAYEMAKEVGLKFIYIDNVPDHQHANTFCPSCGDELITRTAMSTEKRRVSLQGKCNKCQSPIYIVLS